MSCSLNGISFIRTEGPIFDLHEEIGSGVTNKYRYYKKNLGKTQTNSAAVQEGEKIGRRRESGAKP